MPKQDDLVRGTLDLLVLRTLQLEPLHGYGIVRRLAQTTQKTASAQPRGAGTCRGRRT